jgi:hypothetical protein
MNWADGPGSTVSGNGIRFLPDIAGSVNPDILFYQES